MPAAPIDRRNDYFHPAERGGLTVLAALPVKPFREAKGRLAGHLDEDRRGALMRAVAARVAEACRRAGAEVAVVTADESVEEWAGNLGLQVIPEPGPGGLDVAAAAAVAEARRRGVPWCIIHADLPLLTADDVGACTSMVADDVVVLAPSRNGGTNLIAGAVPLRFRYGPGSFARHLAEARHVRRSVVVRPGTAIDLDTPADLAAAAALEAGRWLAEFLP